MGVESNESGTKWRLGGNSYKGKSRQLRRQRRNGNNESDDKVKTKKSLRKKEKERKKNSSLEQEGKKEGRERIKR